MARRARIDAQTALITGASSGFGERFARTLAEDGIDLVVVARGERRLEALGEELVTKHGARVDVIPIDLTESGAAAQVLQRTRSLGLTIDLLINSAGVYSYGRFEENNARYEEKLIALNAIAVTSMARAFGTDMLLRGHGTIINIAARAALQPLPYMATYAASKAFVLSLTEGLAAEWRGRGVRVIALCPDHSATPLTEAIPPASPLSERPGEDPQVAVDAALRALKGRRDYVLPGGARAYLNGQIARFLPRARVTGIAERMMRPRAGEG